MPPWKHTTSLLHISLLEFHNYTHETEWTPFQTHCSEYVVAPGIEPRPLDL
jgi:hypothetical protein